MHRNHLLPIGHLVRLPEDVEESELHQRPVTRARRHVSNHSNTPIDYVPSSSESDYEDICPPRPHVPEWRDLLTQPESVARQLTQVIARDQNVPGVEHVPDVNLPDDTVDVPVTGQPSTNETDTESIPGD